jgi:short-subunit dehydrogenase
MRYRTAAVTGASSGVGRSLAKELCRRGVEVALLARRGAELAALQAEIEASGGRARAYELDVRDTAATAATLLRADDELGGIDLVVANAGVSGHRWGGALRYEDCDDIIAVNVKGAVATLTALLPRMVERDAGHLVGVSSLAQYRGVPSSAAYSASKAFLSTFLEALRVDLLNSNVAVTDVRPGFIDTPMTAGSTFPQPFLIQLPEAVDAIISGIEKKQRVVAFPWPLATLARVGTLLPAPLYEAAVKRLLRRPSGA